LIVDKAGSARIGFLSAGIVTGLVLAFLIVLTIGVPEKTITSTTVSTATIFPPSVTTVDVAPTYGVYSQCSIGNKTCTFLIINLSSPTGGPITIYEGDQCVSVNYGTQNHGVEEEATSCTAVPSNYIQNYSGNATLTATFPSNAFTGGGAFNPPVGGQAFSGCISLVLPNSPRGCLPFAGVFTP
jgi:hypothetical protein